MPSIPISADVQSHWITTQTYSLGKQDAYKRPGRRGGHRGGMWESVKSAHRVGRLEDLHFGKRGLKMKYLSPEGCRDTIIMESVSHNTLVHPRNKVT